MLAEYCVIILEFCQVFQKQPPEVFCKKIGALRNFVKINRKIPAPESLF